MSNQPIELILCRQFADSLNIAVFLVDPTGDLLFYNAPAETILGMRFSETGAMSVDEWSTVFKPTDKNGNLLPPDQIPLVETLNNRVPAKGNLYIDNKKGERVLISVSSFPIAGRSDNYVGAMALFWKSSL